MYYLQKAFLPPLYAHFVLEQPPLPAWMDYEKARQISKYRALGYTQEEVARTVGVSQQTVSRYLSTIRDQAQRSEDADGFFLGLILGGLAAAFLIGLLRSLE